jgi:hypothetical protein
VGLAVAAAHAGAVGSTVETTEAVERGRDHRADRVLVGDVNRHEPHVGAAIAQHGGGRSARIGIDVRRDHPSAHACESLRRCAADSRGGAGNEHNPAINSDVHGPHHRRGPRDRGVRQRLLAT